MIAEVDGEYFHELRQGQVLSDLDNMPEFSVIVSQSCDVVQPKREFIQLAPLVTIDDSTVRRGALNKENPRFPLVSRANDPLFADLAQIRSFEKVRIQGSRVCDDLGVSDEREVRDFGLAVARWFGRFAFPDEVQPWLAPVQELIRSKHDNPNSALGKVLQMVSETRVEAIDWSESPLSLTLHVILRAGSVPSIPEDADFSSVGPIPSDLTALSEVLLKATNPIRLNLLWAAFADALAARCQPKGKFSEIPAVMNAVSKVTGELSTDDEFPLSRVRRSEQLDVDFLSDPVPYS